MGKSTHSSATKVDGEVIGATIQQKLISENSKHDKMRVEETKTETTEEVIREINQENQAAEANNSPGKYHFQIVVFLQLSTLFF